MIVYLLHQLQGVGPGDEIIVPSHTAFPSMEPLIHLGAKPVFADIDDTFVMDLAHVESLITPRTVGIIGVHLYGHPIDNDKLLAIAKKNKSVGHRRLRAGAGREIQGQDRRQHGRLRRVQLFPVEEPHRARRRRLHHDEQRRITPTACGCCAITVARANTTTNSPATTCASTKSTPPSAA
jgi:hypothetical protein